MKPDTSKAIDYEYATLMNMLHVSVSKHKLDEHFSLVWANDFYFELIGYEKEEYENLYHNQCDIYYVDNQEEWEKIYAVAAKTLSEGKNSYSIATRMRRKGGEMIWVRMSGTFIDEYEDGYQLSYTTMTDISDIMQMKVEQSVTYESLPGFVAKYKVGRDRSFTLLEANERFVDFFGEECWNNEMDSLFQANLANNEEAIDAQMESFMAGDPVHFLTNMQSKDGKNAWLQINASCTARKDGDPVYLALFIDVTNETELRQMQEKLKAQAEELKSALQAAEHANKAKSDFLSHMSHDIRTPMNAIMGMTDIAKAHLDDIGKVEDCLKKISLSSQHLLGLINDVLDMSRIESGKMSINISSLSMPALLSNVVAIMQPDIKSRNQQFSIHLHQVRHEQFLSDALRLRQIFINILSNASKFTPTRGKVTVDVEEKVSGDPNSVILDFTIADTGIGMKPEFIDQLFTPFSRENDSRVDKTEGSGLGMAITKKLVDLLGGEIRVDSFLGKGTTFYVRLPMRIDDKPQADMQFPHLDILVVDDDDSICEYAIDTMNRLGINVDTASSGMDALEKVKLRYSKDKRYDAVFLDWKMPDMDGPQTTRKIRSMIGDNLPILIISSYDWGDIEDDAKAAGVDGFISKPLFASVLCNALKKYVIKDECDLEEDDEDKFDFTGKHILLVEDNELNREIAMEMLTSSGAEIECAFDGMECINRFKDSPEGYYGLILMDVQMPVMNGYDATVAIRNMPREDASSVPILAMTADAFAEDIAKAKEMGMNGHIAKPIDMQTLKQAVNSILE